MKKLLWFVVIVVILIVGYLGYLGLFSSLKVTETKTGPYTIVYEKYVGAYQNTGKVFANLTAALAKEGLKTTRGLGIYYDDPKTVPADKLRSDCGLILEGTNLAKINQLRNKFQIKKIAEQASVVAEFPLKNSLSYILGVMKGYPAVTKYIKDKGFQTTSAMELYDMPGKKIFYIMGIKKK